jgi:hypothetical protein
MMDAELATLVKDLEQAAGANLLSVILYGSAASGEFQAKHSDLNVLCLFDRLDAGVLSGISATTRAWTQKGHPAPLVFAARELVRAADIFAIELVDIKASHQVLHGADLVASIEVPMALHHLQVERELRQNLVRLREHYLARPKPREAVLELMTSSISSFTTLFRHAAIALGMPLAEPEKRLRKRAVVDHLAAALKFDARPFHAILDVREGKLARREIDVDATFREYLAGVDRVVDEVDRRLEERTRV